MLWKSVWKSYNIKFQFNQLNNFRLPSTAWLMFFKPLIPFLSLPHIILYCDRTQVSTLKQNSLTYIFHRLWVKKFIDWLNLYRIQMLKGYKGQFQIGFDSFFIKQKSVKVEQNFFPLILLWHRRYLVCWENQFMVTSHNLYAFMHVVLQGATCRCSMK